MSAPAFLPAKPGPAVGPWVVAFAVAVTALTGCGTPCEEAAQICADEGRSSAVSPSAEPATCEGDVEAQATCIADAETCAPDVVEACLKSTGDEDGAEP